MFISKIIYIFGVLQRSNHTKQNIMATINLKTISNKNFESIIQNLIGTNCEMEFSNYTEKHETIALNLGLTIQYDGKTLNVLCTEDEANNYY